MKRGKKYVEAAKAVDRATLYDTAEAISLVKKSAVAKFDETIEVHIRTGCDGRHADQQIRGAVVLPHGTGKKVRVLVFAKDAKAEEAKAAAEEIAANEYVTQEVVDLAEKALLAAHKNAVVKGDVTALENALNNMKAGKENVGAEEAPVYVEIYSARTYAAYESVMNEIREALKDKENVSEKEAQDLTAKLEKAEKALVIFIDPERAGKNRLENAVKLIKTTIQLFLTKHIQTRNQH